MRAGARPGMELPFITGPTAIAREDNQIALTEPLDSSSIKASLLLRRLDLRPGGLRKYLVRWYRGTDCLFRSPTADRHIVRATPGMAREAGIPFITESTCRLYVMVYGARSIMARARPLA